MLVPRGPPQLRLKVPSILRSVILDSILTEVTTLLSAVVALSMLARFIRKFK